MLLLMVPTLIFWLVVITLIGWRRPTIVPWVEVLLMILSPESRFTPPFNNKPSARDTTIEPAFL
jgi:hypothetical protein